MAKIICDMIKPFEFGLFAFYLKHVLFQEYFEGLIKYVTSGPCRVILLTKGDTGEGVVEQWREIIGPFDAAVAKNENPDR